jgi:putative heme d1 biosynthesis radical SAM protein NirJ2
MLVSWNTTNQCNMFCDHCYRDAGAKSADELSTDQARQLIRGIRNAGFQIMIFSGGEPLMRPDIYELGAYARAQGLRAVMGTNGSLITSEVARQMKEAGFMAAGVSLDSLDPEKNNNFRRLENAYQLTVEGMNNLRAAGVPFQIHTTVMDWNVGELEAITDFAIEIGAMAHHVFFLAPTGRAIKIEDEALKVAEYEKTLARLMEKQKQVPIEIKPTCAPQFIRVADRKGLSLRFSKGCLAGVSYCIISPTGNVQPCAYMDMPLGNVKEIPFETIWRENECLQRLRSMDYQGKCGVCEFKSRCGGCRARANYYNGDIMAEDTWCLYQPKGEIQA